MSQRMLRVMVIAFSVLLAGCHRQADPPGDAPTGLSVVPGEGQVVVTWDQQPGLTYWIFFQAGNSVSAAATGVPILFNVQSPSIVPNLANATQYAFVMNATNHDSRAGPNTPVASATTRLAGNVWSSGAPLGAQNLNGVAFGAVPVAGFSTGRLVAVGNAGTIFAGNYNYTSENPNPPGVTSWTQATTLTGTLPAGFTSDLAAVIYTGQFVALGADGSVLASGDSVTWTSTSATPPAPSIPTGGTRLNGIALGLSAGALVYVAVGAAGKIFTSPDLIIWSLAAFNAGQELFGVSYIVATGTFVATGAGGTLLTSTDAITWTLQTTNTTNALRSAAFGVLLSPGSGGPLYAVVGDGGTILTSTDGTTWIPNVAPGPQDLRSIAFRSRFVAVGQGGAVVYSDDGVTWLPSSAGVDLAAVTLAPAMYVAVGPLGTNAVSK